MQLVAGTQQERISRLQQLSFRRADRLLRLEILHGPVAQFEMHHPAQVLVIAQAAAAVFDIRLLHGDRVAKLRAPLSLILQPRRNVLVHVRRHALGLHGLFHVGKQPGIAGNQPRLDQRGLGLHVLVGFLHAIGHATHRMPHFQAYIPQRVQDGVRDALQILVRPGRLQQIFTTQKLNINIALWIQFTAAVAASGHHGERRMLLQIFQRREGHGGLQQVPQQDVNHRRMGLTHLTTEAATPVQFFEPGKFILEKTLVARQLLSRGLARVERQLLIGAFLNLGNPIGHRAVVTPNPAAHEAK